MSSKLRLRNNHGDLLTLENSDTSTAQGDRTLSVNNITHTVDTIEVLQAMSDKHNLVYVTGYHAKDDGAFGSNFFKLVTDIGQVDNGGTIIRTVNGVYELQYSGAVNVKWFGLTTTSAIGTNTTIFQTILDSFDTINVECLLELNQITIDVARHRIYGVNDGAGFNFVNSLDTECILFKGSTGIPYAQNGNGLFDLTITGDRATQTGLKLHNLNYPSGALSHINIERCNIFGFNIGIDYGDNAYLIRHLSVDIYDCNTCLYSDGTGSDYGENWSYSGCAFYNSSKIVDVTGSGHDMFFQACSFDYSTYIFYNISIVSVFLSQCHIEYNHTVEDSFFSVSGNEGYLSINNSFLLSTVDGTSTARLGLCNDGHVNVSHTKIHNFGRSCTLPYLVEATNGGKIDVFRNSFLNLDNTAKGFSNVNLFNNNLAYITGDTAAITTMRTGTNIILSNGTNTDELNVKKTYGGGSNSSFAIYFPLNGASRYKVKITTLVDSGMSGTSYWSFYSSKYGITIDPESLFRLAGSVLQGTAVSTNANNITINDYFGTETDTSVEYGLIAVNLNNVNGSGHTLNLKIEIYGI